MHRGMLYASTRLLLSFAELRLFVLDVHHAKRLKVRFACVRVGRGHFAYAVSHAIGEVVITGHETPLIVGLPRDITCTWSGETNATKMEWFLVGLDAIPIESADNSNSVVLSPDPNTSGLDALFLLLCCYPCHYTMLILRIQNLTMH